MLGAAPARSQPPHRARPTRHCLNQHTNVGDLQLLVAGRRAAPLRVHDRVLASAAADDLRRPPDGRGPRGPAVPPAADGRAGLLLAGLARRRARVALRRRLARGHGRAHHGRVTVLCKRGACVAIVQARHKSASDADVPQGNGTRKRRPSPRQRASAAAGRPGAAGAAPRPTGRRRATAPRRRRTGGGSRRGRRRRGSARG